MKKERLLTALAALGAAFFLFPQSVQAAGFVQDTTGVKYQNDDGTYLTDSWVQVGANIYHLDVNGVVQIGWIQVNGLWYFMDASGVCTNPEGTAVAPEGAGALEGAAASAEMAVNTASTSSASDNIFAQAGWVPFQTTDVNALNNGIAAGLVGFDGASYWAAPAYVQMLNAAPQAAVGTASAGSSSAGIAASSNTLSGAGASAQPQTNTVWLSATGEKYHRINSCGRMNPAKARSVTLSEAQALGYGACSKCF